MEYELKNVSLRIILISIAIGIWAIVLQNTGIIPTKQNVFVKGGYINADVSGSVDVENTVDVSGSVEIDNTVDINIQKINGYRSVFFNNPRRGEKDKYYVLPVTVE